MNELALKLSELLEISVDSAIKLYPLLRKQYLFYELLSLVILVVGVFFILTLFVFFLSSIFYFNTYIDDDFDKNDVIIKKLLKILKVSLKTTVILALIIVITQTLLLLMTPDLSMMLKFLNN